MSEPIKAGDLVQVVRWPCCGVYLGRVFRVDFIGEGSSEYLCKKCGGAHGAATAMHAEDARNCFPVPYLKRIPPLSELEGQPTQQDIKEPA